MRNVNTALDDLMINIKNNLINKVTAIIKAFERPDAVVSLYNSIRKFYPELKIIIVDDSKQAMDNSIFDKNVEYIHTEFDIGLSAGRNLAVSKVKTKYFVLLDDDFLFTKNTKLEKMLNVLETTDFKIVGGGVHDFGSEIRDFRGTFELKDNVLYLMAGKNNGAHQGYKKYDFILNFFMAETQTVLNNPWYNDFKVAEHEDFFYNLLKKNILITDISKSVFIEHYPQVSGDYKKHRERFTHYIQKSAKKNCVDFIKVKRAEKKVLKLILKLSPVFLLTFYRKFIKKKIGR